MRKNSARQEQLQDELDRFIPDRTEQEKRKIPLLWRGAHRAGGGIFSFVYLIVFRNS